jgi:type I restriction enzyme M protein
MAEGSLHDILWQLREGGKHDREFGVALAALIYMRWADFQEAELEAIAAFDETDYKPVLPSSLHWRSWCNFRDVELSHFLKERLPSALRGLHNNRHNPISTYLYRLVGPLQVLSGFTPEELKVMVLWLSEQPFETPSDRRKLLNFFDDFLNATTYRLSGDYRTPPGIADLIVQLASPTYGDRVYDPCFGSGGLLTAACDYVRHKHIEQYNRSGSPALEISGIELNPTTYLIGLVRLTLAGIDDPQIELGNALERPPSTQPQRDGFDVILANLPFGLRADLAGLDHFAVRTSDATGLFIQHALSHLRPNGRAVIVVPQGFLFRGGQEQRLRRLLLEQHTVEAVVSLPHGVFLPYTGIQSAVLVLRRSGPTKSIRMLDAEPFFEKGKGNLPAMIRQDLVEDLVKQLRDSQPGKHCWDIKPETLAEVDWDFTPKRRDQSGLTDILDSLRAEIEVVSLSQCCTIASGHALPRDQLLDTPPFRARIPEQEMLFSETERIRQLSIFDVPVIPYVRIKDVQRSQASGGSSWLSPSAATSVDVRWKLKAGDILLSKSGTIGKAGVVRNGAVGAIPAAGLFVLRPDQNRLDPHFLLAYMNSAECLAWLDEKARGATIRHLSIRVVEKLPVPLPPFQVQQRVATEHREHGVDALAFLSKLLTQGEQDPVALWVDKAISVLPLDMDDVDEPLNFESLDRLAADAGEIRNRVAHGSHSESVLAPWLIEFSEAISGLRGIGAIPQGPGLLSVLQETIRALSLTISLIKGDLPSAATAKDLTKRVTARIDRACSALLAKVELLVGTDTSVFSTGKMVQFDLDVHNRGPLPLRNLHVRTHPDWGKGNIAYLAENTRTTIALSGVSPKKPGSFTLTVKWSVEALDGKPVEGVREIALDFVEKATATRRIETDIGASPYVCGDPVRPDRNNVFFGRDELLEQIRRQITLSGNVVLLEGNRRSGKSSVLLHLEGTNAVPGWLGVYCSLQGAEGSREGVGVPTTEVFREMARSIAKSLQALGNETPLPDGTLLPPGTKLGIARACRHGISEESPFSDFRDYVDVALDMLAARQLGLLLMLDEFDKLQEGIDSGVTSPQIPENIRFLVQTFPKFCAILTGSRRLKRLREEHWSALYGLGTRFGVTCLPVEPARRLVTEPVKGRLNYSPEAVERAIFLTSGQPYLLQCLCNRIFDLAAQLKLRSVTLDLVNQSGNALVQDNEHFASLWDYAGSDRRRFLLALCHGESGGPDPLRLGIIQEKLLEHGIEISDETLIADLEYLRELELIELQGEVGGGYYVLAIPLMGTWIENQQDFAVIKRKAKMETEDQHE